MKIACYSNAAAAAVAQNKTGPPHITNSLREVFSGFQEEIF